MHLKKQFTVQYYYHTFYSTVLHITFCTVKYYILQFKQCSTKHIFYSAVLHVTFFYMQYYIQYLICFSAGLHISFFTVQYYISLCLQCSTIYHFFTVQYYCTFHIFHSAQWTRRFIHLSLSTTYSDQWFCTVYNNNNSSQIKWVTSHEISSYTVNSSTNHLQRL